jgi:Na+/H+ antiporter NhaD/arsenite permease-like protein
MQGRRFIGTVALATLVVLPVSVSAAPLAPQLDGAALGLGWGLPFAGLLISVALLPMVAPMFWHHHFGKVSALWAAVLIAPLAAAFGIRVTLYEGLHAILLEYLPLVLLLFALFVVAGGIRVAGEIVGTPLTNTAILAFGTMIASLLGTTGAAMLLIRLLIQANERRPRKAHVMMFFIILVANIGGALTPLGDPPLFLGFLEGVSFAWTLRAMFAPMLLCSSILLALFYLIDRRQWRREGGARHRPAALRLRLEGGHNLILLAGVVAAVLASGLWRPGVVLTAFDVPVPLEGALRDVLLLLFAGFSWLTTRAQLRIENAFTWEPIQEVAAVFAGIFITIIPVLAILKGGAHGALASVVAATGGQGKAAAFFWLTGLLSSILDNAPTYLVFFNLAGGDSAALTGPLATLLLAISCGAVFFGALTYIGNAPNFMVKSICEERGIRMPSFFGYMLWSFTLLLPTFALVTVIFFRD